MYRNRLYLYQKPSRSEDCSLYFCVHIATVSSLQQQRLRAVNGAYKNRTSTELGALFTKKLPQTGPHTRFMNVAKMWPMKTVYRTHTSLSFDKMRSLHHLCLVYMEPVEK